MVTLFSLPELWFFALSAASLWLVPAAFGRAAWLFPAWFGVLGLYLLVAPAALHPAINPWIWLLLSQGPWVALIPDLFAHGRAAIVLDSVPLRSLLAWSLLHLLAARHVWSAFTGELPPEFALEIASGETLTAIGGILLWLFCRPASLWFRFFALFWNAQALVGSLMWSLRLLRAHPGWTHWGNPEPDLYGFFRTGTGALEAFFWIPLAVGLHAALFYKLLRRGTEVSGARNHGDVIP
jgi:hypothetical protein